MGVKWPKCKAVFIYKIASGYNSTTATRIFSFDSAFGPRITLCSKFKNEMVGYTDLYIHYAWNVRCALILKFAIRAELTDPVK